jgi:EmrB/QacA subfamily drug resistance transporter
MSTQTSDLNTSLTGERPGIRRWLALITISLAQLLVTLDIMVVNIALPSAQNDLGFADASRAWVLTAYTLAFGSLMLFSGRLADRFGRRRMFIIGLVGVGISSGLGGLAPDFGTLVAARAVQGVFAAMLAPTALALVASTFPAGAARARAFGVFGTISMAGGAIGLLLGGVLTDALNWRWTMFIGVFFALLAIVGALAFLDRSQETRRVPIDAISVLAVSLGLIGMVYGFSNAGESSWSSPWTIAPLTIGAVLLAAFVWRQTRIDSPLLPLHVLADRDRVASLIGVFITMGGLLATIFFAMSFVQNVLGWSTITTGLAFLPQPVAVSIASIVVGPRLIRLLGPKVVVPLALTLGAIGVGILTQISAQASYTSTVLPSLILIGFAGGLFFPTANSLATRGVPADEIGVMSAVVSTSQQVGGTIAVAVVNTVAALATAAYATRTGVDSTSTDAVIPGLVAAFWWTGGIFLFGAIATGILLRRKNQAVGR